MSVTAKFCILACCHLDYLFICPCKISFIGRFPALVCPHKCIVLPLQQHLAAPALSSHPSDRGTNALCQHPDYHSPFVHPHLVFVNTHLCSSQTIWQEHPDFSAWFFVISGAVGQAVLHTQLKPSQNVPWERACNLTPATQQSLWGGI